MPDSKTDIEKNIESLDKQIQDAKKIREAMLEKQKPIESIYKWEAPERIFETKSRRWYVTMVFIAMIIIVYSALTQNFLLILVMLGLVFMSFALNTVPPANVTHEITNRGLHVFGELLTWNKIIAFWITKRGDNKMLNFEVYDTPNGTPRKVLLLEGKGDLSLITSYIVQFVDYWDSQEAGTGLLSRFLEGEHQPLITFLNAPNIKTKDPKDAPNPTE